MADTNPPVDDLSLSHITQANFTEKQTSEDQKMLIHRALSSGDSNLHIYVRQLPPLQTTQIWYRRKVSPHKNTSHCSSTNPVKTLPPSPPMSEQPVYDLLYANADKLNDDILLAIFYSYRLDHEEDWNCQLRWCKLSHVCQKW